MYWFDAGHVGRLDEESATLLKRLIVNVAMLPNAEHMADIFTEMTEGPSGMSRDQIRALIGEWVLGNQAVLEGGVHGMQNAFTSLLDMYARKRLIFKEQWVVLMRTLGLLSPILADVDPGRAREVLIASIKS